MKNLQQKFIFIFLSAFLATVLFAGFAAPRAEAWVKVTVRNNRSHTITIAFCWSGHDYGDDTSKGWYNVKPGETRTITLADAVSAMTMQDFGYYAYGTPQGGKTLYWQGKESDANPLRYWIHIPKSFTGGHWDDHDGSITGGRKVIFRHVSLTKTGVRNMDAAATLVFNN